VKKNKIAVKTEVTRNIAEKTIKSMFPSEASFLSFKENDGEIYRQAMPAITRYAFNHAVIDQEDEKAFIEYLKRNSNIATKRPLPDEDTFAGVLTAINGKASVNTLIKQLEKISHLIGFSPVSATMVTRLKQNFIANTPKKRALLRLLAFWMAENRPEFGWHYEALLRMSSKALNQARSPQEKAGVTISFHLRGQGEMILSSDITWLKNELSACVDYLKLDEQIHKKAIEAIGTTSFSIRILKKQGPPDVPILYQQAIRNAMAVAHQMSIRWLLCTHSTPRKRLIMVISAGRASEDRRFDLQLPENVPANDTGIYLSDFAHLCAEINNIKGFRRCPSTPAFKSDTGNNIWSLSYFWPNHYYDYVPCLLENDMLPKSNTGPDYEAFHSALLFPESCVTRSFGALEAMHRHPQHTLHFIEIAKLLRARQMHHESEEVISRVLLAEPENLAARYIRLLAHGHLANREKSIGASLPSFDRSITEGEHILKYLGPDAEILWAMGIVHFNRAIKLLHYLRRRPTTSAEAVQPEDILNYLKTAANYFRKGLAASAAGQTEPCLFWLQYALSFIELFSGKENKIFDLKITLEDDKNIFRQAGARTLRTLGLLPNHTLSTSDGIDDELSLKAALMIASKNKNTMLGRSYIPYIQYTYAMVLWDFSPRRTAPVCRIVRYLLDQARINAEKLIHDNLSVYHVFSGFMFADQYIRHIDHAIDIIKTFFPDDDMARGNDFSIGKAKEQKMSRTKLMLLEVDRL